MHLLKSYLAHLQNNREVKVVPVTIEYDRVFEAEELFSGGPLSSSRPAMKMATFLQRLFMSRKGNLGKCIIKHCEAIDLDAYVRDLRSR